VLPQAGRRRGPRGTIAAFSMAADAAGQEAPAPVVTLTRASQDKARINLQVRTLTLV